MASSILRDLVEDRAHYRCEYCQAPMFLAGYRFHIEHIEPQSQGGDDLPKNLALACASCNLHKGSKTFGVSATNGRKYRLFHPRRDKWSDHFAWSQDYTEIVGITERGHVTVRELSFNEAPDRQKARTLWHSCGYLP